MARVQGRFVWYNLGYIKSVKIESHATSEPTLELRILKLSWLPSGFCPAVDKLKEPHITCEVLPVSTLENPGQCDRWIESKLKSMEIILVAADPEGESPQLLLRNLLWKMRQKWEEGEMSVAVLELAVTYLSETVLEFDRRKALAWVIDMSGKFKGAEENCTCPVCLNNLNDAVELPCGHVFHCQCIREWFKRMVNCPCCRSPVKVSLELWVHREESALSDPKWFRYLKRGPLGLNAGPKWTPWAR